MREFLALFLAGVAFSEVSTQGYYGSPSSSSTSDPVPSNVRVVGVLEDKYLIKESNSQYTGFIPDYIDALSKIAIPSFTYTITNQADGNYGNLGADGQWNGIVGQLVNKTADVAAADLSITSARGTVVDFAVPYLTYNLVVLTQTGASLDNIKYITVNDADQLFLQSSQDPAIQAIWANIQANKPQSIVDDSSVAYPLVQQGGWALIAEDLAECGGATPANCPAGTTFTGAPLNQGFYALAFQQGSPLRKIMALATEKLQESGVVAQLVKKWKIK